MFSTRSILFLLLLLAPLVLSQSDGKVLNRKIHIYAKSAGFEDGNIAEIWINGQSVIPSNLEAANGVRGRGIYVATLSQASVTVKEVRVFDIHKDASENVHLRKFLSQQVPDTIVVMAVRDEGSRTLDERSRFLIEALGSRYIRQMSHRDGWCMIGRVGGSSLSAHEQRAPRKTGFAEVGVTLWNYTPKTADINLLSAGYEDGNTAEMLINGRSVLNSPLTPSSFTRGMHVAVLNQHGDLEHFKAFDMFRDPPQTAALESFLTSLTPGHVVAITTKDEASRTQSRYSYWLLKGFGSRTVTSLRHRDSWCMIGRVGALPGSAIESFRSRKSGSAKVRAPAYYLGSPVIPSPLLNIRLYSTGYNSGNRADVHVNGVSVFKSGLPGVPSRSSRGLNVAIIDQQSETFTAFKIYDTYASSADNSAFHTYIRSLGTGTIVMIAVQDEASNKLDSNARSMLRGLGSKHVTSIGFRDSWSFVTMIGHPTKSYESLQKRGGSPATVNAVLSRV